MHLIRETRGGELYQSEFGKRMRGTGEYAEFLKKRFDQACERLGLNQERYKSLDTSQFSIPPQKGDQLGLL
jgi:hypothetical protein